jgi:hypothetical protein
MVKKSVNFAPLIDTKRLNEAGVWILGKRLTVHENV